MLEDQDHVPASNQEAHETGRPSKEQRAAAELVHSLGPDVLG